MIESNARIVSSILFCGVLAAVSCMAAGDPDDPDDELVYRGYDDGGYDDGGCDDGGCDDGGYDDGGHDDGGHDDGGHDDGGYDDGGHDDGGHDDGGHDPCEDDHEPPHATPKDPIEAWPPNHQYKVIEIEDCIEDVYDACDPHVKAKFIKGWSDEPENGQGDGNTEDDIKFIDKDEVKVRKERKGPGDGRVYKLKWVVEDDHNNKKFGICEVHVPHDQSGDPAVYSGKEYEVWNNH